jgi:hypothetical protein
MISHQVNQQEHDTHHPEDHEAGTGEPLEEIGQHRDGL